MASERPGLTNAGLVRGGMPNISPDVAPILFSDPDEGGDGSYHVNGQKEFVQWRWRVGQLNQGGVSSALPASGVVQHVTVDFGAQGVIGDSEIAYFFARDATANSRFAVRPRIGPPINQYLANVPLSSNLVFGTSQLPGYLPSSIYAYLNSDLDFNAQALGATAVSLQCGAFCRTWNDGKEQSESRRAAHDSPYTPMWISPEDKLNPNTLSGPEVTIAANATVKLRFPAPYDADFLAAWILDDSTSTTGLEPSMTAIIQEEDTRERLIDLPVGIDWRNFIACPTVTVTGMPAGGVVRAMSLKSPRGGWTHRIPRTSALEVQITSTDAGTITFRGCLLGWAVKLRGERQVGR